MRGIALSLFYSLSYLVCTIQKTWTCDHTRSSLSTVNEIAGF